jgi:signal transduction histidine kinase
MSTAVAPPRILIVDDEAVLMKALCETLNHEGYVTTGFTSAEKALALLRAEEFEVILTDLMMPEMDGIAFLRSAQKIDPNLVGIIMTGQGTITSAVEAMKAGAFDYIQKPFKVSLILPVLARALAMRRLRLENTALHRRVQERTTELEAANQELEAFSYSVSHDLRAPLRAICGFSGMLVEDYSAQLPDDANELLNKVSSNASRMSQLIDDLLRFSRLSMQPLAKEQVNITAIVHMVLEQMRTEQPDQNVQVKTCDLPYCYADSSLLKQVLINLLSNAFKYTRSNKNPVVEVGWQPQEGDVIYFVRDNGVGFDMEYAEKLFGVFQRLHRADEFEGTGVGLSIAQRIIRRHGGRIWAEAEVGKGATFYFTLTPKEAD